MKNRFLLFTLIVMSLVCLFAISISAEAVYVNHNGEQVSADSADIAYEIELEKAYEKTATVKLSTFTYTMKQ